MWFLEYFKLPLATGLRETCELVYTGSLLGLLMKINYSKQYEWKMEKIKSDIHLMIVDIYNLDGL